MRLVLLLIFFASINAVQGQGHKPMSLFDTLYMQKELKITLTYPFDSLYRAKRDEIEAFITIRSENGLLMDHVPMTLNLRGKFRRMKCTMPPLLLNFKKSTLRDLRLDPFDEIKLVTHCLDTPEGTENLEEERLCYQLYESITPYAYRTISITVDYCDAYNPGVTISSVGFLLEPDKVISNRLGTVEKKVFNVSEDSLHFETYSSAVAFNFLIGNRDWSVVSSRNAKLFYDPIQGKYLVIPYDFDYSNIVAASYRRETLPSSMTHPFDRRYEGEYFKDKAGDMLKTFSTHETVIMNTLSTANNPIDNGRRKKISRYFDGWFNYVRKGKTEELRYGVVYDYKGDL